MCGNAGFFPRRQMSEGMKDSMTSGKDKATLKQQIDENLRRVYQQAANEPVPEKFQELLRRLKEQDQKK
jgi:hypothetical protein